VRPFFITGFGASGTRWLAKYLDQQPGWKVTHEDGPHPLQLRNTKQGRVSSIERCVLAEQWSNLSTFLDIAVIVRDPLDIAEHALNKGTFARTVRNLDSDLVCLDRLLAAGAHRFLFEEITEDPSLVTSWLGWDPLPPIDRIGHQPRRRTLEPLQCESLGKSYAWYRDKWLS
jgi:hypothetical protein